MIRSKSFVIERAIDFISIFLRQFFFFDTINNSFHKLITAVCTLFPAFHFDVTKVSLASQIEHQKFSVLRTGHGRNAYGLQSFLSPIVFFSVK